jgi:hypothetical protein
MQFQTPQFVEVEDKIIGPLSFRQFLYLAGGGGLSYTLYRILPLFPAILLILPVAGLAVSLAFVKIYERPFIDVLEAFFNYSTKNKLYIWKQEWKKGEVKKKIEDSEVPINPVITVPTLSQSKLKDIAWGLDVNKNIPNT